MHFKHTHRGTSVSGHTGVNGARLILSPYTVIMLDQYMRTLILGTGRPILQNWDPWEKENTWGEPYIHHSSLRTISWLKYQKVELKQSRAVLLSWESIVLSAGLRISKSRGLHWRRGQIEAARDRRFVMLLCGSLVKGSLHFSSKGLVERSTTGLRKEQRY